MSNRYTPVIHREQVLVCLSGDEGCFLCAEVDMSMQRRSSSANKPPALLLAQALCK